MTYLEKVKAFVEEIKKDPIVQKNLYEHVWLSGSSTEVYPIGIWASDVTFQWKSNKNIYDKFIKRTVEKYSDILSGGYFRKSDGSCPSEIVFLLRERLS